MTMNIDEGYLLAMRKKVDELADDVGELETDVNYLHNELSELRSDNYDKRAENNYLQGEIEKGKAFALVKDICLALCVSTILFLVSKRKD